MSRHLLDIALAEFTTLREEILMKLKMFYQMYVIYFSALALFYGYVVNNKQYDFIMVVPLVSLALFYRLFYDQKMIKLIDSYIKNELIPNQLTGSIYASVRIRRVSPTADHNAMGKVLR